MPKAILPAIVHTLVEARGDVGSNYINRKFGTVFDRSVFNVCMERTRALLEQPLGAPEDPQILS